MPLKAGDRLGPYEIVGFVGAGGMGDTRLQSGTSPGMLMGTARYMSPEQVRARPIDHRTDG